jgi:hypothetical protein
MLVRLIKMAIDSSGGKARLHYLPGHSSAPRWYSLPLWKAIGMPVSLTAGNTTSYGQVMVRGGISTQGLERLQSICVRQHQPHAAFGLFCYHLELWRHAANRSQMLFGLSEELSRCYDPLAAWHVLREHSGHESIPQSTLAAACNSFSAVSLELLRLGDAVHNGLRRQLTEISLASACADVRLSSFIRAIGMRTEMVLSRRHAQHMARQDNQRSLPVLKSSSLCSAAGVSYVPVSCDLVGYASLPTQGTLPSVVLGDTPPLYNPPPDTLLRTSLIAPFLSDPGQVGLQWNLGDREGSMLSMKFAIGVTGRSVAQKMEQFWQGTPLSTRTEQIKAAIIFRNLCYQIADDLHADSTTLLQLVWKSDVDDLATECAALSAFYVALSADAWVDVLHVIGRHVRECELAHVPPSMQLLDVFAREAAARVKKSSISWSDWVNEQASLDELVEVESRLLDEASKGAEGARRNVRLAHVQAARRVAQGLQMVLPSAAPRSLKDVALGVIDVDPPGDDDDGLVDVRGTFPDLLESSSKQLQQSHQHQSAALLSCALAALKFLGKHGGTPSAAAINAVLSALDRRRRYDRMHSVFQNLRQLGILPL